MKKYVNTRYILTKIIIICMLVTCLLSACHRSRNVYTTENKLIGKWYISEEVKSARYWEELEFFSDGSVTTESYGGKYTVEGERLHLYFSAMDFDDYTYEIEDDCLYLQADRDTEGNKAKYTKEKNSDLDSEENDAQQSNNSDTLQNIGSSFVSLTETGELQYPTSNNEWEYNVYSDTTGKYDKGFIQITGYKGTSTNVTVPDSIDGIPVAVLGQDKGVFPHETTSVNISDNIVEMSDGAFSNSGIKEFTLPSSVSLGEGLFSSCQSLEKVTFPDNLTSIPELMFYDCDSLKSIDLPDSCVSIGIKAFCNCSSLESISFPDSCTLIENEAFSGCESLKSVNFNKVETIGAYAFSSCTSLKTVSLYNVNGFMDSNESYTHYFYSFDGCQLQEIKIYQDDFSLIDSLLYGVITPREDLTIYAHAGTEVAKFCAENSINFKLLED